MQQDFYEDNRPVDMERGYYLSSTVHSANNSTERAVSLGFNQNKHFTGWNYRYGDRSVRAVTQ